MDCGAMTAASAERNIATDHPSTVTELTRSRFVCQGRMAAGRAVDVVWRSEEPRARAVVARAGGIRFERHSQPIQSHAVWAGATAMRHCAMNPDEGESADGFLRSTVRLQLPAVRDADHRSRPFRPRDHRIGFHRPWIDA